MIKTICIFAYDEIFFNNIGLYPSFMKQRFFLLTCIMLYACSIFAQQDSFVGTWVMEAPGDVNTPAVYFELQVAEPEQQTLYPAQIKFNFGNFKAVYQLLLVKKNIAQLAIGRNKFALKEDPFSIGTWTILLNGTFDLAIDIAGNKKLTINRMPAKRYGIPFPAIMSFEEAFRTNAIGISDFLKKTPLQLKKINQLAWRSADVNKILFTYLAPAYFGIVDTLYTKSANASLNFSENNKSDNDSISVMLNGSMIIDKLDISKAGFSQDIKLDTGLNILCFFADNYGRIPPNTGRLNLLLNEKKYMLDFTSKQNLSATFIVAKIYFEPLQQQRIPSEIIARKTITQKIQQRETKLIDSIKAETPDITLAIWDDAVEDGDSISLQINDDIYLPGLAVKKKPQFIKVKLYPGENKIIFIADNLGSIAPNTSILEIIDGKRRKSYMIDTNLGQNSAVKILYDYKPQKEQQ
jgi:hypothetical protein